MDISRFVGLSGGHDIAKRNHEALGNLLLGFPSPTLRHLARSRAQQSPLVGVFVEDTIERVEEIGTRTRRAQKD